MGRTFENRKLKMAKRSDRDAKAFTRAGREISMAVKSGGPDIDNNPALRRAVQNARSVNMPKDRIAAAIQKASGGDDTTHYEPVLYEGYAPHGIALMVEAATDNPTRTIANVRFAFKKGNGNLGSSGSVAFMFNRYGVFRLSPEGLDRDELELELIDHGLDEIDDGLDDDGNAQLILRCQREDFGNLQTGLDQKKIEVKSSGFEWIPSTTTQLDDEQLDEVLKLIDRLEQDDDVQAVFHNLA